MNLYANENLQGSNIGKNAKKNLDYKKNIEVGLEHLKDAIGRVQIQFKLNLQLLASMEDEIQNTLVNFLDSNN